MAESPAPSPDKSHNQGDGNDFLVGQIHELEKQLADLNTKFR